MGCGESKKKKKVQPEYTCKISANNLDDSTKGIYLGKITYHPIFLAENCIDGDKKNKQLQELRRTKGKIVACGFLHDGSAVLVDEIRKIALLLQKDKDACNFLILKSEPIGIAVLGIDIFITQSDKKVEHATVVNDKIVHQDTFKTSQPCLGLASFNGDIAVGFKNGEIQVLDRKFQKHGAFFLPKFEDGRLISPTSITQFKQTLLVTDCFAHAVVRVTLRGEPLFVYAGMTSPRCTVVDNSGNIILAGYDDLTGDKIQHLSPRGEKIPSRMSRTDVAQFPYCVAFYRKYSKLLIAGESDRCETCYLQITETSNFCVEPDNSTLVDATTDTVSENISLIDFHTALGENAEKPSEKLDEETRNYTDTLTPVEVVRKQSEANLDVSSKKEDEISESKAKEMEKAVDKTSSTDVEKTVEKTSAKEVEKAIEKTSSTDVEKAPTPSTDNIPNEVPDNTAVTVYDKTNKGVVKKVLITVREKKPKSGDDNVPITVFEKKQDDAIEHTPITIIDEQNDIKTAHSEFRQLSLVNEV